MKEGIAFCGLDCYKCPAYLATKNDDSEQRAACAKYWSKEFDVDIKPKDINCDGCQTRCGRIFNYCKVCEIRKCGLAKQVKNCGYCDNYPCSKLDFIFKRVPDAKKRLDELHRNKDK